MTTTNSRRTTQRRSSARGHGGGSSAAALTAKRSALVARFHALTASSDPGIAALAQALAEVDARGGQWPAAIEAVLAAARDVVNHPPMAQGSGPRALTASVRMTAPPLDDNAIVASAMQRTSERFLRRALAGDAVAADEVLADLQRAGHFTHLAPRT